MAKSPSLTARAILICLLLIGLGVLLGAVYLALRTAATRHEKSIAEKAKPKLLPPADEIWERPKPRKRSGTEIDPPIAGIIATIEADAENTELKYESGKPETPAFSHFENRLPATGLEIGADLTVADFNGDHQLDVLTNSAPAGDEFRLYLNRAGGGFEESSTTAGLAGILHLGRSLPADFDNDGDLDLFVHRSLAPSTLIRNNGDGTFEDVTEKSGLAEPYPGGGASWVDFDRDGWIDLCLMGEGFEEKRAWDHRLFHNQGNGSFQNLGWESGLQNALALPGGHTWLDLDLDGFPDLVAFPRPVPQPDRAVSLAIIRAVPASKATSWRFHRMAHRNPPGFFDRSTALNPFDFDNDGRIDLLINGSANGRAGRLFQNQGYGDLNLSAIELGVGTNIEIQGWSQEIADLNVDGYEDLILGTTADQPNRVFLNHGGDAFREVTFAGGFGILQHTFALAAADLDADGDPDLLAAVAGTRGALLENPGFDEHAWLALDLEGVTANRAAIGARVSLVVRDRDWILHRIERTARGPRVELGLGKAMKIESLEVEWPVIGWPVSRFTEVPMNHLLHLREGESKFHVIDRQPFKLGGGDRTDTGEPEES